MLPPYHFLNSLLVLEVFIPSRGLHSLLKPLPCNCGCPQDQEHEQRGPEDGYVRGLGCLLEVLLCGSGVLCLSSEVAHELTTQPETVHTSLGFTSADHSACLHVY